MSRPWPARSIPRDTASRLSSLAFVFLAAAVGLSMAALVWWQFGYGLEYDESYLLFVAARVAEGAGYVDDGISFSTSGAPWDPNISTGPTVLVPAALMWSLTDGSVTLTRLVPVLYFLLLVAAIALLFHRAGGRWVALAAVSGLLLTTVISPDLQNASLMPGRFVGELPATALLVLSAYLLSTRAFLLAGLVAGLSILTKLVFLFPVVALLVVWAIACRRADRDGFRRLVPWFAAGMAAPVLAVEAVKAVSLGAEGYLRNIALTQEFVAVQSMPLEEIGPDLPAKISTLMSMVTVAGWALIILAVVTGAGVVVLRRRQRGARPGWTLLVHHPPWLSILGLSASSGVLLVWWLLRSQQQSGRPALPALLLLLAVSGGVTMHCALALRRQLPDRRWAIAAPAVAYAVLLTSVVVQGFRLVGDDSGAQLMRDQVEASAVLLDVADQLPTDGFWTNPELQLLTGLPQEPRGHGPETGPGLEVYTSIRALLLEGQPDAGIYEDSCARVLHSSPHVLVCLGRGTGPG